ncbi:hypothetical protein RHMOL_Rhmol10G0132200 [Rhododendron molle]|uniref:Uncharacterized protein n=2 Tax=Rhododendron molle TaxID=49168 RepID=A0ACC0M3B1_RHOML|nr:hypothetical protein RHMOL_Rhmol10G0132200 [Rhododendron molle]
MAPLKKQRIIVNKCCMRKRDAETVDHLLIHCPVAWELWSVVFSWFGLRWAMSRNVMELLIAWNGARVGKRRKCAWAMIPLSLMWTIWRERNWTCFEGIEKPLFRIKRFVVSSLYSWDKGDCNPAIDQFLDWLELFFVK